MPVQGCTLPFNGPGSSVGIATGYGLGGPGIESPWGARFSAPVQTGPGAHTASCTIGTGSFPGVKRGRGVTKFANNINEFGWETVAQRRLIARICAIFKTHTGRWAWKAIGNRLLKPCYLSWGHHIRKIRTRKQRTDVGKYSFVNRIIKSWNQLPASLLASFPCKLNTFRKRVKNIHIYIKQDATLHRLFYLETALHVSGGTSTHHQERKQLYLQHLVFVTL